MPALPDGSTGTELLGAVALVVADNNRAVGAVAATGIPLATDDHPIPSCEKMNDQSVHSAGCDHPIGSRSRCYWLGV